MDKCVFIHTNERQWLGALVAEYSLRRNSRHAQQFDVRFIHTRDHPFLAAREGQRFLRGGTSRVWRMDDLQSFTPLRFAAPQLMNWQGRAVVIDPDVFAVGDIYDLLTRDMGAAAVMGRHRSGRAGGGLCRGRLGAARRAAREPPSGAGQPDCAARRRHPERGRRPHAVVDRPDRGVIDAAVFFFRNARCAPPTRWPSSSSACRASR